jgi:hypothetical protein
MASLYSARSGPVRTCRRLPERKSSLACESQRGSCLFCFSTVARRFPLPRRPQTAPARPSVNSERKRDPTPARCLDRGLCGDGLDSSLHLQPAALPHARPRSPRSIGLTPSASQQSSVSGRRPAARGLWCVAARSCSDAPWRRHLVLEACFDADRGAAKSPDGGTPSEEASRCRAALRPGSLEMIRCGRRCLEVAGGVA